MSEVLDFIDKAIISKQSYIEDLTDKLSNAKLNIKNLDADLAQYKADLDELNRDRQLITSNKG